MHLHRIKYIHHEFSKEKSLDFNSSLYFFLLILILAGCRNEHTQVVVTTPTPAPTVESITAMDPTIAAILAQVSPTPEITPKTQPNSAPTQTPEFVCNPPANWVAYTVQPNDTLFALANALGISVGDIKNANCKLDDFINIGEVLFLPQQPPIPQPLPAILNPSIMNFQESTTTNSTSTVSTLETTSIQELPLGVAVEITYFVDAYPGAPDLVYPTITLQVDTLHISNFQPNEMVWIVAIEYEVVKEQEGTIEPIQVYSQKVQVNSDGSLTTKIGSELSGLNLFFSAISNSSSAGDDTYLKLKEGTIKVINNDPEAICRLFLIPIETGSWTDLLYFKEVDQEPLDKPIESGETHLINTYQGIYDIEAQNCNNQVLHKENNVEIRDESIWTVP